METIIASKTKTIASYLGVSMPIVGVFEFLQISIDIMIIWAFLMFIDTILGWIIAIMRSEFASRTAQNRLLRKCVLIVGVGVVALVGTQFPAMVFLAQMILFSFMLAELVSILRHIYTIYTGEKLPESDIIKKILKYSIRESEKSIKKSIGEK